MTEYCEDCGTEIIYNCMVCGAPNCCPKCCNKTTRELFIEESKSLDSAAEEVKNE